ncbi:hypothetical protein PFISCL1PPCAC_3201, partial [Pristionchus fissidentatus]
DHFSKSAMISLLFLLAALVPPLLSDSLSDIRAYNAFTTDLNTKIESANPFDVLKILSENAKRQMEMGLPMGALVAKATNERIEPGSVDAQALAELRQGMKEREENSERIRAENAAKIKDEKEAAKRRMSEDRAVAPTPQSSEKASTFEKIASFLWSLSWFSSNSVWRSI